jgi:hypothetical protein
MERPTVSKIRATAPTAMVARGRFSVKTWAINYVDVSRFSGARRIITCRGSRAGHENENAKVGSSFVAQRARGIDQSSHTIRLDGGANERSAPSSSGRRGLFRFHKFLLGVGSEGTVVRLTENGAQDGQGGRVVEEGA